MTVIEGGSVIISCNSTGAPVPSIAWTLNGQPVTFNVSEVITSSGVQLVRRDPNDASSGFVPVTTSSIVSSLRISNAEYPDHDGVYTCTGTNNNLATNSSDIIIVEVISKPKCLQHVRYYTLQ